MAFNLLQIAKFINGERPSADKFNSIFTFIDSKIRNTNISLGSNISDESTKVSIYDENTQTNILFDTSKKGFKQKQDNEFVLNARNRHIDLASITNFIGSASNLNPLMLNELQTIKEIIPAGVTEYNTKYPVFDLALSNYLTSLNSSSFVRRRINNLPLEQDGDFYLGYRNSISINNTTYTTEITWCKPTETSLELEYVFNPETISNSMLSYQGASYNTIPDLNTPKNASSVFIEDQEYFYNLKFSEKDDEGYVTITLPFAKYVSLNVDNQETSELNSGNPTFHNQIKLPEIFKEIQLESNGSEFLIPKGLLYLVHFDNPTEKLIENDYIYINETTIKVSGISDDLLNCLLAEPSAENYKQMHLLTIGTDITTSLLDIRNKLSSHNHDGSFGEEKIHIKNIEGIYEYRSIFNSRVYYPTKLQGHIATQYLHRDGYRYNSDPQNADNALLGDLLLKGNSDNSSFKLFFGEEVPFLQSFSTGQALIPGYLLLTSNLKFSWIGLSSNSLQSETDISFNIQGSENSHVSIISNRDLNIASKDKIVSIIKNVNTLSESGKILDSSYEWPSVRLESSAQIQTENLNANINQNQIWLYNDNNAMILNNKKDGDPDIALISENKDLEYSNDRDQFNNYTGLNSIIFKTEFQTNEESRNNSEMISFTQGINTSLFQIKEEYLSDKRDNASKDFFKKEIPSYKKQYNQTSNYSFEEQSGGLENTNIIEINNSTKKKEGCFVYVVQHLIDDRKNPYWKFFHIVSQNEENYPYLDVLSNMINKKSIYNTTYDRARNDCIINRKSIYNTFVSQEGPGNLGSAFSGDLMYTHIVTGYLYMKTIVDNETTEHSLKLVMSNLLGGGNHYNDLNYDVSPPRRGAVLRRMYKHNPFPCSKEYVNQHFYIYAYDAYNERIYRYTSEFSLNTNVTLESEMDYAKSFNKTRVLTKIVWKKFWLKENSNENVSDFEELLLYGTEKFNNSKYVLVNQGYLIDCAIPPSKDHSIETYQWDLSEDFELKARENNYKRVCEFYEVDKNSDFYGNRDFETNRFANWIAGEYFEPQISVNSLDNNLSALNVEIEGGLPFTRHGNLQSQNDYQDFFSFFKKHEFEDDNVIIYFGKGFVNFHETKSDLSDDDLKYDIVLDNHWKELVELERTLNIKLKESNNFERNYKSKQNIKIIFSDFNGENLNLINEILLANNETALPDCFIFGGEKGPPSSVIQYLWKIWRENKEWNDYGNHRNEIFKYSLDSKLYNSINWIFGVILFDDNYLTQEVNLFNEFPNKSINLASINDSTFWRKHINFRSAFPYKNQQNLFGEESFNNPGHFHSEVKPRTFFTYFNIVFDKENFDSSFERKINNQINLKTNGSNDNYLNCNNLIISLKNRNDGYVDNSVPIKYFNIGPIQGFYNIEIDKFINNEKSWWSISNKLLLNEKFGCSLFDIKVNTDLNFCFVC